MNRARSVLVSAVVLLSGVLGAAQQLVRSDAVLIRDSDNQLFVSTVLARPGDTVEIAGGQVVVNGRATAARVQGVGDWSAREVEPGTYFVAGDPAGLGTAPRAWGLIPESRLVSTVQIGALPTR